MQKSKPLPASPRTLSPQPRDKALSLFAPQAKALQGQPISLVCRAMRQWASADGKGVQHA